jgi:hypothetical protein
VRLVINARFTRRRLNKRSDDVTVLVQVPLGDSESEGVVLVEADRDDIPGGLTLASPQPGQAAARAAYSLSASLEQLQPVLRTVKDKLTAAAPEHFTVEFGVKLGGETGVIVAKGTAEVNLKITMTWGREPQQAGSGTNGRV